MPASVVQTLVALPPQVETLSGTLRVGRAGLSGGYSLDWQVAPGALLRGRIGAQIQLAGPDTRLTAELRASPFQTSLQQVSGRAGPGLLALAPGLPVQSCTPRAVVAIDRLSLGRGAAAAEGSVDVSEGICIDPSGREIPVPALALQLATRDQDASAALLTSDGARLAEFGVTGDRRLLIRVEPAGAALVPGMPSSAATVIEYPF